MDATDLHLSRLSQIKEADKTKCCPECKSTTFKQAFDGERECKACGQSWFADVTYSCGCLYCDLGVRIIEGMHPVATDYGYDDVPCTKQS